MQPQEYASLCVLRKLCNLTYHQVEDIAPLLIGKTVNHNTVG